jgi:glycosyltransferase involved in cell wall biosynthesis
MKIIHVVETWTGGIATYVRALAVKQRDLGHDVTLLCDISQVDGDLHIDGIVVIDYRSSRNPAKFWSISRRLQRCIKALYADVVHCHSSFPGMYVRLQRHPGVRIIYTPHAWSFLKTDVTTPARWAYGCIERLLAQRCDQIVCMSFDELRAARKYCIPTDKIEFIYTGIASIDEIQAPIRNNLSNQIKVGYFGRLDYQKGFDVILEALPLLNEHLVVHAFGASVRGGIETASETRNDPRITYHGWLDASGIGRAMHEMDVIVVPSRWEGLALVPIEAMRAGKVVVVSGESSLPEQVIHGYNGIILRDLTGKCLADNLNRLTPDECHRMGKNARHVFEGTFQIDRFLTTLMSCYERA